MTIDKTANNVREMAQITGLPIELARSITDGMVQPPRWVPADYDPRKIRTYEISNKSPPLDYNNTIYYPPRHPGMVVK